MKARLCNVLALLLLLALAACSGGSGDGQDEAAEGSQIGSTGNPAIDGLSAEIRKSPQDASLYAARGELFYENQGFDEAIRDLTAAVKLDSLQPAYFHLLADAYLDYFKSRQALGVLKEAVERFPEDIPTLLKLSEYYLILKQHEESMKVIDRIMRIDPQNAEGYFMFGMNFKERGDTTRAINSFQKAVENDADLVDAWINLGQLHTAIGSPLAERYFDNAVRVDPKNITALHAQAAYLSEIDDLDGALGVYRKIVLIDQYYDEAFFNSGLLYLDLDSMAKAEEQFDLATKASPTHIRAYYYRGVSKELQGRPAAALQDYEQALRMAPGYAAAQEAVERLKGNLQ